MTTAFNNYAKTEAKVYRGISLLNADDTTSLQQSVNTVGAFYFFLFNLSGQRMNVLTTLVRRHITNQSKVRGINHTHFINVSRELHLNR